MILTIIIFQGIIFCVLIFVLRHFMQSHVSGATSHLGKLNEELLKQQAELKQKMAEAEKEYEVKSAKLQQEITARQAQVKQEATKTLEDARLRGTEEREKMIKEAIETRDKIRQEIMQEMEAKSVQYAKEIIGNFMEGNIQHLLHEALVKIAAEGLQEMNLDQFQIGSGGAEVVTAIPMSDASRTLLKKALHGRIKRDVQFTESTDPALICGVILRFGTLVMDGSLANRLQEASARLKKEAVRKYQGKT